MFAAIHCPVAKCHQLSSHSIGRRENTKRKTARYKRKTGSAIFRIKFIIEYKLFLCYTPFTFFVRKSISFMLEGCKYLLQPFFISLRPRPTPYEPLISPRTHADVSQG